MYDKRVKVPSREAQKLCEPVQISEGCSQPAKLPPHKPTQVRQLSFLRSENMKVILRVKLLTHTAHQPHQLCVPILIIPHELPHHSARNVSNSPLNFPYKL